MKWAQGLASLFRVAERPGVVEWLEANVSIPRKMSPMAAGRFCSESKPFMRWMLECWNPASGVNEWTVTGAAQLFKTTVYMLGICYRIRWEPVPILIEGPSVDWCKREVSERRLHPLIDNNPCLASEKPMDPDKFKLLHMQMRGGDIVVVGANSDTQLAGGTFGIAMIDEASKITQEKREEAPEAHPIFLTFERTNAYGGSAFKGMSSTPNSPDHPFWQAMEAGDFTHPAVMCPHCKEWFNLEVEEDKAREYRSLVCDPSARGSDGVWDRAKVLETARYVCPRNGCVIGNEHKRAMLRGMEEDRKNASAPKNRRSFRVNYLHNPDLSWGDALHQFFSAQGDLFGQQNFRNSKLALTWEEMDCHVKDEAVSKRKATDPSFRRGTVPSRPAALILTSDPGERMTHWEVAAIMPSGEILPIDWGTVLHWTVMLQPGWIQDKAYPLAGTAEKLRPQMGFIDSGDWTYEVYQFCRASKSTAVKWYPTKGSNANYGTWARTSPGQFEDLELYTYVDYTVKNDLYFNRIAMGGTPGLLLPWDTDAAFIGGHAGQQLIKTANGRSWKKIPWDHYGDCTKLAVVGSWVLEEFLREMRGR